jgi:hypothetical protein
VGSGAGNINPAALQMDKKQHVIGYESSQREDLDRKEVGAGHHRKVSANEFCPRGRSLALRRRRHAMTTQNIADRLIRNLVAQIRQSSSDPVVAPGPVLLGHANDQILDVFDDWRPARASTRMRSIEFSSDKPSVPPQDGVRQGSSSHLSKSLAAQSLADFAKRRSLTV